MNTWRRVLAIAATITTLALFTGAVVSTTQAGSGPFKWLASNTPVANVAPAAAAGGGGSATSVAPPIAVSVASPVKLISKLQMEADVTVTCGPFLSLTSSGVGASLSEASGHAISEAGGSLQGLTCDGGPHTYALTLLAANIPFRPGKGVASTNVSVCGTPPEFAFPCVNGSNIQAVDISK